MANPCEKLQKDFKEAAEKYDDAYEDYQDNLDEDASMEDDLELTREARNEKMISVGIVALAAGAFSAMEEYGDSGQGRVASAAASGLATAVSTGAAATDYFDYEKDTELITRNRARHERKLRRSEGKFEEAAKEFHDAENELYHCEYGKSEELQFDEYGNEADEDDIDTSYGTPDTDDDEDDDDFIFEMGEPVIEDDDEMPDGDMDIKRKEYKNVKDSEGDYYDMPLGDADHEDFMPLGDADYR